MGFLSSLAILAVVAKASGSCIRDSTIALVGSLTVGLLALTLYLVYRVYRDIRTIDRRAND